MATSIHKQHQRLVTIIVAVIAVGIIVALIIAGVLMFNRDTSNGDDQNAPRHGTTITVEGEYVCLPKKGDGPHTLECAFGLRDGETYYSLEMLGIRGDPDQDISALGTYKVGDRLRVIGTFKADDQGSYVSIGSIEVESVEPIEE